MKKYDGLFIFAGTAKEEALEKLLEKARAEITRLSGSVLDARVLGKRTFARPMGKRENGVYVRIRFELDPQQVAALVGRYRLMEDVFRVQVQAVDERRETVLAEQSARNRARAEAAAAAAAAAAPAGEPVRAEAPA
jgi:ribosomal protein S6